MKLKAPVEPFADFLQAAQVPVLDLTALMPYDRYQGSIPILDQGQIGSCVAHAHTTAVLKCRDLAPVLGVSAEPLLGPVDLRNIQRSFAKGAHFIDALSGVDLKKQASKLDQIVVPLLAGPGQTFGDLVSNQESVEPTLALA